MIPKGRFPKVLAAALLLSGVAPRPVLPLPPVPALKEAFPRRPSTLQEVAGEILWDPARQGALLIVAPEETYDQATLQRLGGSVDKGISLPARDSPGLPLSALESYFDRQAVSYGDVTVLAPTTMTVLHDQELPAPSAFAGMSPAEYFRMLQASLSEAQWRKISSPTGLGADDVSGPQRTLFLASLPEQMRVQRQVGRASQYLPVSAARREGIRLRLHHRLEWVFPTRSGTDYGPGSRFAGDTTTRLTAVAQEQKNDTARERQAYGVTVIGQVAAQDKRGQLDFHLPALNREIALNNLTTLGDLINRVRTQTRVEIYADERYERLPVLLRGDRAPAGTLLKACARAVNGTYRKVGPAYVLTDDVIGFAAHRLRLYDWIQANRIGAAQSDANTERALRGMRPMRFLRYDPADPLAPGPALQKALATSLNQKCPQVFPVASLPPAVRRIIRHQQQDLMGNRDPSRGQIVDRDEVTLRETTRLTWEVPGIGVAMAPYSAGVLYPDTARSAPRPEPVPRYPLPTSGPVRAALLHLGSVRQMRPAIRAARRAGFNEVWVEVDPTQQGSIALLAQVVQNAKRVKLKIRALVRAEHPRKNGSADSQWQIVNPLGETFAQYVARVGNAAVPLAKQPHVPKGWLAPDAPGRNERVVADVQAVAHTPGLAGVVVSDLIAPGFQPPSPWSLHPSLPAYPGVQGDFSESRRLAFLRRFHTDPLDVTLVGDEKLADRDGRRLRFLHPFQGNGGDKRWNQFQNEVAEAALTRLQKRLAASRVPVWYYYNYRDAPDRSPFVESRDKPESARMKPDKPPLSSDDLLVPTATQRTCSRVLLHAIDAATVGHSFIGTNRSRFLQGLSYRLDPKREYLKHWDGLVLDLTGEPLPSATASLRLLPPARR